ncbi:MAG: putative LPS assembly protein LptD, partial [Bacteroidia bacterium]|nr:putative LPS assembly protein LptD [Bacteroidia bacterium]
FRSDSLALLGKSSLDVPAFSGAKDSIVEVFTDGQRVIYYYGDVKVQYQNMEITAEYMEYDMNTGEVFACGVLDTLTGEWKGQPVMTQGGDKYEMEQVRYNFNSRKARITNMTTNDNEGILHGQNIKMFPDKSVNITQGRYTVCDAEEPHYYLDLSSAKVITQPTQKTVFGPAHPVIEGVPIPIFLPFGFIPKKPQRATGMLMPT